MIRRLLNPDYDLAHAFCAQNPALNLYFLGNLESLGLETDYCQFWGSFDENTGDLNGVLNRYMDGWNIADGPGCDYAGFGIVVDEHPAGAARLQDNTRHAESFLPYLTRYRPVDEVVEYLCELDPAAFSPTAYTWRTKRATMDDYDALCAFYADAGTMARTPRGVERPLLHGRVFVTEIAGDIVSSVLTNAETQTAAMIGGVYTPPEHRGHGYAAAAMTALCASLLDDELRPVLYYHHPAAGTIYRRLGFTDLGLWKAVRLETCDQKQEVL
ncbi:MAG: GNAT family N-acetyltransferase [Caldilineales bacterium]|nr:GNAT family N-acetyltransferase [Caldilineales bacterium]